MQKEIEQLESIYHTVTTYLVNYSFQILGAVIIVVLGILVARKVSQWLLRFCDKHQLDSTLSNFIASVAKITIIVMVGIIALGKLGISVTPFLATIGALSLGAGLAVQGLVSNYGAGLNIIITRPFVVGDTIEVSSVKGLVKEVHLGYVMLIDEDGVEIMVPNRHIVGEVIKNSQQDMLVEISIGIAYSEPPEKALAIVEKVLEQHPVLQGRRQARAGIDAFADSSVNLGVRCWVATENYHEARFALNKAIYLALLEAEITIPFPQREVRLLKDND